MANSLAAQFGKFERAEALLLEGLAIHRAAANKTDEMVSLINLGEAYLLMDRPAEARGVLLESQQVIEAYDQPSILALYNLGRTCWRLSASNEAFAYLDRATQFSR